MIRGHIGIELPDLSAAIEAGLVVSGLRSQPDLLEDLKVHNCDARGNVLEKINLPQR